MIGSGRAGAGDLLLELRELAALCLEGEDGLVNLRDLRLLHEHVPHLVLPVYTPREQGFAGGGVDGGGRGRKRERGRWTAGGDAVTASQFTGRVGENLGSGSCYPLPLFLWERSVTI